MTQAASESKIRNVELLSGRRATINMQDGRIAAIDDCHDTAASRGRRLCVPAAIDLSVRLRQPGPASPATIASELAAAAQGGVAIVCVPPDSIPVVNNPAVVEWIDRRARTVTSGHRGARAVLLGALTEDLKGTHVNDLQGLTEAGCVGVAQCNGVPEDLAAFRRALVYAAGFGLTVHVRPRTAALDDGIGVANGSLAIRLGLPTQLALSEVLAVSTLLELARDTGVRMHIGRISAARSVDLLRAAKSEGLSVTADVAIANLLLNDASVETLDARYHLSPPLRSAADQDALSAGAADGTLDAICSDHQPHDAESKNAPFSLAATGGAGVHHLWPAAMAWAQRNQLGLDRLCELLVSGPAAILNLDRQDYSASLAPTRKADLCVLEQTEGDHAVPCAISPKRRGPLMTEHFEYHVTQTWIEGHASLHETQCD